VPQHCSQLQCGWLICYTWLPRSPYFSWRLPPPPPHTHTLSTPPPLSLPPGQVQKLRDEELQRRASEPLPLSDYYDEVLLLPDLSNFDPSARCRAESNGEGDVLLADVSVDVPLHTTSLAGIQVGTGRGSQRKGGRRARQDLGAVCWLTC
jgi:hypothetical protein